MRRIVLFLSLCLASLSMAAGREIYVDNVAGDDRHDGAARRSTSAGTGPCRTIARALRSAQRGDQIILASTGEPYRESITLQGLDNSGRTSVPFEIIGNGAVLDGSIPVPGTVWQHHHEDVFRFRPKYSRYFLLFSDYVPCEEVPPATDDALPKLEPLQWCRQDGNVYFRVEKDRLPGYYHLTQTGLQVGITLYHVDRVIVRDLTVQGYRLDGINAHDGAFKVHLLNVTSRGNGRSGISVGGASRVKLEGCLLGNNGVAQLRTEGWSTTNVVDSELLDNTAPPVVREAGRILFDGEPWDGKE